MESPRNQYYQAEGLGVLESMRAGVSYIFGVSMRDLHVKMRPLTIGEQMNINNEVLAELRQLESGEQHAANESFFLAKKMLSKACCIDGKVGPLTEPVLAAMTPDELMYLYRQYLAGVEKVNPVLELMQVEQVKALVDQVKKKELELTGLSTLQLLSLARFFILQSD